MSSRKSKTRKRLTKTKNYRGRPSSPKVMLKVGSQVSSFNTFMLSWLVITYGRWRCDELGPVLQATACWRVGAWKSGIFRELVDPTTSSECYGWPSWAGSLQASHIGILLLPGKNSSLLHAQCLNCTFCASWNLLEILREWKEISRQCRLGSTSYFPLTTAKTVSRSWKTAQSRTSAFWTWSLGSSRLCLPLTCCPMAP